MKMTKEQDAKREYVHPESRVIPSPLYGCQLMAASNDNIGNIGGGGYGDGGDENLGSKEHKWYDDDDASPWNDAGYSWIDENL